MSSEIAESKLKFHSKIPDNSILFYAVSKDNRRQTGDGFKLIVDWVIENKKKFQV